MKLSSKEIEQRADYIMAADEMLPPGVTIDRSFIGDIIDEELFEYAVKKSALDLSGVSTDHLPAASDATSRDRIRLSDLFVSFFQQDKVSAEEMFVGCNNVRDKIAKLMDMTEANLLIISCDMGVEFAVRKYASAMLEGDIDDMHNILNQSLGKPLERTMTVTRDLSAIEGLSTDELKQALGIGVLEIEAEVE
jgi:hypothetical protein